MDDITDNQKEQINDNPVSFEKEINRYIMHLDSLRDTIPLILELVSGRVIKEGKAVDSFINLNKLQETTENGKERVLIPTDKITEFIKLSERLGASVIARQFLPINFIVALVSQYDAYLGRLIRTIFLTKPEILNASEKNILFSELIDFKSIDEAKEYVIENEVESVMRESHLKQFKWLEGKLSMKLREDLPRFTDFIEITERRNLFVHCNGVVSRQYLINCKENSVPNTESVKVGDHLKATPTYLAKSYSVLFEIGVKLGQVTWRKLCPDKIEDADSNLVDICFDLLVKGRYKLAINLLNFATGTLKKHHNQELLLVFIVNKALAYYLSDEKDECYKVLDSQDWSATSDTFKLAIAVLRENYSEAATLMIKLGPDHDRLKKGAYMEWPLFKKFRDSTQFKETFVKLFKEEFKYIEDRPQKLEELIDDLRQLKKHTEDNKEKENAPDINENTPHDVATVQE
jgi:hypothetical protein